MLAALALLDSAATEPCVSLTSKASEERSPFRSRLRRFGPSSLVARTHCSLTGFAGGGALFARNVLAWLPTLTAATLGGCAPVARSPAPADTPLWDIAFVAVVDGEFDIWRTRSGTVTQKNLTQVKGLDYAPRWSGGARALAFYSNRDGNEDVFVVSGDGSDIRKVTADGTREYAPAISPDGSRIAFVSNRDGNNEIYVASIDGSNPQRITVNAVHDESPAWSPDGRQLAFSSMQDGDGDVWVADVATRTSRRIVKRRGFDTSPDWAPDGTAIVFQGVASDSVGLFTVSLDGTALRRVPPGGADERHPRWSPDGKWLLFTSSTGSGNAANSDVWCQSADGTRRLPLVVGPGRQEMGTWLSATSRD